MLSTLSAIRRIFTQLNFVLGKKLKKDSVGVFLCMLVGSGLELVGISAIYPFLQAITDADALKEKGYIKWIFSIWPDTTDRMILLVIGMIIIMVYIIKNVFMVFSAYMQVSYAAKLQRNISVKVLNSYLKRPYEFFLNTNSSVMNRGITSDVAGVYQILLNCFTIFAELITVTALGIFLFKTDWSIALGAMLLAALCFVVIIFVFKGKMKRAGNDMREATALKGQYGYQAIWGVKEITVLDRRDNFVKKYDDAAFLEQKSQITYGFVNACPDRILEGLCVGGFMGIVCIKIALGVELDSFIPILGTFAMGAFRILPSISKISSRVNSVIFYQATLQNTYNNLREVQDYEAKKQEHILSSDIVPGNIRFVKGIEVKGIKWEYQNAKEAVLDQASLYIRKGESVAFIGASGAGKTTLADIIMGLLKPQEGKVEMDGIDIFSIPHQWARIISYVPQSVFLIDDTVRNNVAFGLEEDAISDDKVWSALEQAQLKKFVENLPKGLDTIVGERGVKFSGGQRQRIAIARALYENPDILVLDEATSALDNETETAVMESIDALRGSKTLIVVAHRLTTIRNCDRIYEIKDGVAVERNKEDVFK